MDTSVTPSRPARCLLLACAAGLGLASCATRNATVSLGDQWPASEPVVDMSGYESVQRRPGQRRDVAVAVAISGGGMRAANFAAGVLMAMEATPVRGADGRMSNLLREVDYFSTVSGGGLAAGSYITHLNEYLRHHPEDPAARGFSFSALNGAAKSAEGRNWPAALSRNYQSSMAGALLDPRMIGPLDRGDVLERRLDDSVLGRHAGRSLTLGDIFMPKGRTPRKTRSSRPGKTPSTSRAPRLPPAAKGCSRKCAASRSSSESLRPPCGEGGCGSA